MMKLAVAFALAVVAGSAYADKPKPFTSKSLGFTATFPADPKESTLPDGSGNAATIDKDKGIMYMVGSMPIAEEAKSKTDKQLLDDGIEGALEQVHGKLEAQKDVKLAGSPGREFEIGLDRGHATFRAFVVRPKVYLIGVVFKNGVELPLKPAEFFKSLQVEGKK